MSERDRKFLQGTGITISYLAKILEKSRQYLSVQINKRDDFFNEHYLVRIGIFVKEFDLERYNLFMSQVKLFYPEHYDTVAKIVEGDFSSPRGVECHGEEFWFITGDFYTAVIMNEKVYEELRRIVSKGCILKFIILQGDIDVYRDFFRGCDFIECPVDVNLEFFPTIMLQLHKQGVRVYGISEKGFVALSSDEGVRLRAKFGRIIMQSAQKRSAQSNSLLEKNAT